MALALPAASVPPIIVQKTSAPQSPQSTAAGRARQIARGEDHGRDRRDQQQLDDPWLGQRDVGADACRRGRRAVPVARVRDPDAGGSRRRSRAGTVDPGRVVAGDGQADQRRPDDRAEREVERPGSSRRAGSGPAAPPMTTWIANRTAVPTARRTSVRVVALRPPGDDRDGTITTSPTMAATQRWRTMRPRSRR